MRHITIEDKKSIEQMAKDVCEDYGSCHECSYYDECDVERHCTSLYMKGYRKTEVEKNAEALP